MNIFKHRIIEQYAVYAYCPKCSERYNKGELIWDKEEVDIGHGVKTTQPCNYRYKYICEKCRNIEESITQYPYTYQTFEQEGEKIDG
jgi:hypothetical protein